MVAEVKFAERTSDYKLRAPVYMRLRDDKAPQDVEHDDPLRHRMRATSAEDKMRNHDDSIRSAVTVLTSSDNEAVVRLEHGEIHFTSLNKVLWPPAGNTRQVTKRDLAVYLLAVSPYLMPLLLDRPITLARYPDGVDGKHFIQRHWSHTLPEYVETLTAFSEDNNADVDFILCNNTATLLWLVQLGNLEMHAWFSRCSADANGLRLKTQFSGSAANVEASALNYPDIVAFDLDPYIYSGSERPGQEPEFNKPGFAMSCEIAQLLRSRLTDLGLTSFVKTSGKTGLHIYVPVNRRYTFDSTRAACETICRHLQKEMPNEITMEWSTAKRRGKVFLDLGIKDSGTDLLPAEQES